MTVVGVEVGVTVGVLVGPAAVAVGVAVDVTVGVVVRVGVEVGIEVRLAVGVGVAVAAPEQVTLLSSCQLGPPGIHVQSTPTGADTYIIVQKPNFLNYYRTWSYEKCLYLRSKILKILVKSPCESESCLQGFFVFRTIQK